ncbi:hypothetical protein Agabi119p4_1243 [Agaricus bisporus var. burnettii]|uniref:Uncharacterized protein n=2 Tax=Agaricus bisporus var. burnettii TaxID=192524 RepID=A0A8H7KLI5_AGABI|nr:hypothetical protein Agabi119p4_1243 [Agaricus bisporus var. burnettii]
MFECLAPSCKFSAKSRQGRTHHQFKCPLYQEQTRTLLQDVQLQDVGSKRKNQNSDVRVGLRKVARAHQQDISGGRTSNIRPADPEPESTQIADASTVIMDDNDQPGTSQAMSIPPNEHSQIIHSQSLVGEGELYPTRSGRRRRQPQWFQDMVPSLPTPIPHMPPPLLSPGPSPPASVITNVQEYTTSFYETQPNGLGLYRSYTKHVEIDPESEQTLDDLCDAPTLSVSKMPHRRTILNSMLGGASESNGPYKNTTTMKLISWFTRTKGSLTLHAMDDLVKNVIQADDFQVEHLKGFNAKREAKRILTTNFPDFLKEAGWLEGSVELKLPPERKSDRSREIDAKTVRIGGIYYRPLTEIMKAAFQDENARDFHYSPFKLYHKKDEDSDPERVYMEAYNSNAFIDEDEKLQKSPRDPNCNHDRAVAAMIFHSDETRLANFGDASLWPIYCFFGNQSKYSRSKPSNHAAHHVAYIPSLPDTISENYLKQFERSPSAAALTHLKRDLMHAIWKLLLDDEFVAAYEHGIAIKCADGIKRQLYPRILSYSADYPEKVLLATIRYLGTCPCVRCDIEKKDIDALGSKIDLERRKSVRKDDEARQKRIESARKKIFRSGERLNGKVVENILKPLSEVPTRNAFSERLSQFGFQFHQVFVPDLLHEFELGVWKAAFTHLVRLLYCENANSVTDLDERFRQTPRFGRDTIRRSHSNASAMKQLAARDFEDLLQCAMPVFEDLFPDDDHNKIILDLLFVLSCWHALAKLRMQTTLTLHLLQQCTQALGYYLRKFVREVCSAYEAHELDREAESRHRRESREVIKGKEKDRSGSTRIRTFNLFTIKLHSLGDYVEAIKKYGPSDGMSTQVGELEHRQVKRHYARTNKRFDFPLQIAKHQQRERILLKLTKRQGSANSLAIPFEDSEPLPSTSPNVHYDMSSSKQHHIQLTTWISDVDHADDPAFKNFLPKLQDHVLSRMDEEYQPGKEYSQSERNRVAFAGNRLYMHKYLRVNFTTYDGRRSQDSINPRTCPDIMTFATTENKENDHPYCYARVLGIFHAEVFHRTGEFSAGDFQKIDFLWVRWFSYDTDSPGGFESRRPHRLSFYHYYEDDAFGFLDPNYVLRAAHIIPAFEFGHHNILTRQLNDEDNDWRFYYVNMFVDRDMFMRFIGGAIGHIATAVPIVQNFELVDDYGDDDINNTDEDEDENEDAEVEEDEEVEEEDEEVEEEEEELNSDNEPNNHPDEYGPEDGENEEWIDEELVIPEDDGYGAYD